MIQRSTKWWMCSVVAGLGLFMTGSLAQAGSSYHHQDNNPDCPTPPPPPTHDWTCFDLQSTSRQDCGNADFYTFVEDGITLTVTAKSYDFSNNTLHDADVNKASNGLGVDNGNDNNNDVDSSGWWDSLIFTFSEPVNITHLKFTDFGSHDDALILNPTTLATLGQIDLSDFNNGEVDVSDLPFTLQGTTFAFTLPDYCDDYRIKGICVTSAVPTPAAAGAGLVMLGGLLMRRRRRQTAA